MKLSKSGGMPETVSFDMTPMIDCTFQLVIFFMLTINFSNDEQNEMVRLPQSELAKPADAPLKAPITLQLIPSDPVDKKEKIIVGSEKVPMAALKDVLKREKAALEGRNRSVADATIIIRADRLARTGSVQEMIEIAQSVRFEKFILRAKEKAI